MAARTRAEYGRQAVGPLCEAIGTRAFDSADAAALGPGERGSRRFAGPLLERAGLRAETGEALALVGTDAGTAVIHVGPPRGTAFFGPVISRLPGDQEAIRLWDHVAGLASFPGFAELKRSVRERPRLRSFGVSPGEAGIQQDWHGGSRRLKKEDREHRMRKAVTMSTNLTGTVALITAATSGIGKATAFALAGRGAHVLIGGRHAARGRPS